jgi:hypothetical protein
MENERLRYSFGKDLDDSFLNEFVRNTKKQSSKRLVSARSTGSKKSITKYSKKTKKVNIMDEIEKLPLNVKKTLKINKLVESFINTEYAKYIDKPEVKELDKLISSNSCINEKSLYELCDDIMIDGFKIKRLKAGANIYKSFPGFYTEEDITKYCKSNKKTPSWLGNKYLCYTISNIEWNLLVSFKVKQDIHLLDFFDVDNLNKLYDIANKIGFNKFHENGITKKNFLEEFIMINGLNISFTDQINYLYDKYKYTETLVYTDEFDKDFNFNYCKSRRIEGLNPINGVFNNWVHDKSLFKLILSNLPKIDGFIRYPIKSSLEVNGKFTFEELVLKNGSLLLKTFFDYDDPLCWVNWKIKGLENVNYKGFHINRRATKFTVYRINDNENFNLVRFYFNNTYKPSQISNNYLLQNKFKQNGQIVLSYNIDFFKNINNDINTEANIYNIINLIKTLSAQVDILCLYNVSSGEPYESYFINALNKFYKHKSVCVNTDTFSVKRYSKMLLLSKIDNADSHESNGGNHGDHGDHEDHGNNIINITLNKNELNKIYNDMELDMEANKKASMEVEKDNELEKIKRVHSYIDKNIRNIIIYNIQKYKIAFVNLEFEKYKILRKYNKDKLNKLLDIFESNVRIKMLEKILAHDVDIIIGCFNFTLNSPETEYLAKKHYYPQNDSTFSTINKRIDHCFMKNRKNPNLKHNVLLKCNYTYSLPMLQYIN